MFAAFSNSKKSRMQPTIIVRKHSKQAKEWFFTIKHVMEGTKRKISKTPSMRPLQLIITSEAMSEGYLERHDNLIIKDNIFKFTFLDKA